MTSDQSPEAQPTVDQFGIANWHESFTGADNPNVQTDESLRKFADVGVASLRPAFAVAALISRYIQNKRS